MTAQINDSFLYDGESHALASVAGHGLFEPEAHGLHPVMIHTACWRGWYCTYALADDRLVVQDLTVNHQGSPYPLLAGVAAREHRPGEGAQSYTGMKLWVPFSGTLVLGREFIREMYVHMGFQRPYTYQVVHGLRFVDGRLTNARDLSAEMARLRAEGAQQDPTAAESLLEWIERRFSRKAEDT